MLTARKFLEFTTNAIGKPGGDTLVKDIDTMRQDGKAVIQWNRATIALGQGGNTLPP
jgi:hypothetical protein